ncbi:MAG: hypothetical protein GX850_06355 [Clostridiaceae bacterium]|jgi:hypothetical protein|nr:hypothetical protein [Clostridiaceae bacterium]
MNTTRLKKRKQSRDRNWIKSVVGLLAIAIFLSFIPGIVEADQATKELVILPNNSSAKREVVYGKLSARGDVEQIYVVNHFHPQSKTTLTDYGNYENVIQLTGAIAPVLNNSTVTIAETEGPYYYQGNLVSRELPWDFDIYYRLDGENRRPKTLSGESGKLEMELVISRNEAVDPAFFDHYALQISIPIDPNRVIIEAATEGFLISSAGTEHQLNYIVLPGQESKIELVLDVNDFAMGQITLAGVLLSFDMDMSEMEDQLAPLDDLSAGIADFAEGAERLKAGYRDLQGAFKSIVAGSGKLVGGGRQLDQGVHELRDGAHQLLNNGSELKAGSKEFLGALNMIISRLPSSEDIPTIDGEDIKKLEQVIEYLNMLEPLLDSLLEFEDDLEMLRGIVNELIELINLIQVPDMGDTPQTAQEWRAYFESLGIEELPEALYEKLANLSGIATDNGEELERIKNLLDSLVVISQGMPELDMSIGEMINELKGLINKANEMMELIHELEQLPAQMGQLKSGMIELRNGYVKFDAGLIQYIDQGVGGIADGLNKTASGATEYIDGVASLNAGLDQYYSGGLVKFSGGVGQLSDGASILRDETSDLRQKFEDAIREKLDEFANVGFETVSFVSDKNKDVASVQFVCMTEEIPPVNGK